MLRFLSPLLAAPPPSGQLQAALAALAEKTWRHPVSGLDVRFGVSTLERWSYAARAAPDPVAVLLVDEAQEMSPAVLNRSPPLSSRTSSKP